MRNELQANLFITEEMSPVVRTLSASGAGTFEIIHFGGALTLYVGGGMDEIDCWDRLRRACVEAIDRVQRRRTT